MPRYYFDIRDSDLMARDTEGLVFDGLEQATREAKTALHEMALDDPAVHKSEVAIDIREGETVMITVTSATTVVSFPRARRGS